MLVLGVALAILGAAIFLGTDRLRRNVRAQMVNRDGEILNAVALAQQFAGSAATNLELRLQNPAEQLALALNISRIQEGVLAVRLFDASGKFVTAFPPNVSEATLAADTLAGLNDLKPVSRFHRDLSLTNVFFTTLASDESTNTTPLMEVNIPIHARGQTQLLAAAQLILDARNLETEFARFEAGLWRQALLAFLAGGAVLTAAFVWAYRRLQKSHQLLQERTARLLRANHELSLAAKTGALGAVTAHLVHGLSNPLANLQDFVASRGGGSPAEGEWEDIAVATRRMQQLVHEVVRVLGEETDVSHYEITFAELAEVLSAKIQPVAERAGVSCEVNQLAEGKISNHHANLMLLILENLAHNAIQVTPRGKRVQVSITSTGDDISCAVADEGPGFPPHLRNSLFTPCRSTKGGSGLGLAISRQLAQQLGARLDLESSGPEGCVFVLKLPCATLAGTIPGE